MSIIFVLGNMDYIKKYNKYYSTNSELIHEINLSEYLTKDTNICEPFCGDGSLLNMLLSTDTAYNTLTINDITKICLQTEYDRMNTLNTDALIDCVWKDTPHVFIITNPPYSSKNKLTKEVKQKYKHLMVDGVDDLYLMFIQQLLTNPVDAGFVIIPSDFIFGKRNKVFNRFMAMYGIDTLNIYEKQTFEKTTQAVISLLFYNKNVYTKKHSRIYLHKHDDSIVRIKNKTFNRILTQDITEWLPIDEDNDVIVSRAYKQPVDLVRTHIKVSLLDYNMKAFYVDNPTDDKETDRAFMTICVNKNLNTEDEHKIIDSFNETLDRIRNETHSLLLTSYREFDRKRLTFTEAGHIIKYIIGKLNCFHAMDTV